MCDAAAKAPATTCRRRVFFVVVGEDNNRLTSIAVQRAIACAKPALDFDAHVLEHLSVIDATKTYRGYAGIKLPLLSPTFLFPAYDVVYLVCAAARLADVPNGAHAVLLRSECFGVRDDALAMALANAHARLAQLDTVLVNLGSTLLDDDVALILRRGAAVVAANNPRIVDARVAKWCVKAQRLVDREPWLPWADFLARVGGSADVARALHDAGCVVALPSPAKPEFAALSLGWLFDKLRHVCLPAFFTPSAGLRAFMWVLLNDRQLERPLLDVVWPDAQPQLRDALVQYFETAGVLGPCIPASPTLPMLGERWVVPHLIWCGAEPWCKINAEVDVDDWRVSTATLHCLRRRFEVATLSNELWRTLVQRFAALFRIELNAGLAWIKVTSLDDDETLVILARSETLGADAGACVRVRVHVRVRFCSHCRFIDDSCAVARAAVAVVDVMSWYPACRRGVASFQLFQALLPVLRQAAHEHCGPDVREGVPLLWDGAAGLGWSHADPDACCAVARHGSVGVVTVADLTTHAVVEPVHTLRRAWDVAAWGPCLTGVALPADAQRRLLPPSELGGGALLQTPERPRVDRGVVARKNPKAAIPYSWRQLIPWCNLEAVAHAGADADADADADGAALPELSPAPAPKPLQDIVAQYFQTKAFDAVYKPVGKGGYGAVWHAIWHAGSGDVHVAVKASLATAGDATAGLRHLEVTVLNAVRAHPNVVRILGLCGAPDVIVMEYLQAQNGKATLRDWCRAAEYRTVPYSVLVDIGAQLCAGFGHVHACGVLHRDVKPSNVLMVRDETRSSGWLAKVSDFGISEFLETAADGELVNVTSHALGTRGHQAPEQVFPALLSGGITRVRGEYSGDCEYTLTRKSDVFSFGIVLYRLFCGCDNASSAVVVAESVWDNLASTAHGSARSVQYALDIHSPALPIAQRMRNSLLFAKCARARQLPTLAFVLAEWCLRPQASARPSFAQLAQVLALEQAQPDKWLRPFDDVDDVDDDDDVDDPRLRLLVSRDDDDDDGGADAFAAAVWACAHAAWRTPASATVFLGLPRSVVVQAVLHADVDVTDGDRDAIGALVDPIGNDVVTFAGLCRALRGCTTAAAARAKAQRPLFAVPPLPTTPFASKRKDVDLTAGMLRAYVKEANDKARWDPTAPELQQLDEPEQSTTVEAAAAAAGDDDDGAASWSPKWRTERPERVFAITGAPGTGKSRFLLETVHALHSAHPALFVGGTVFASLDDVALTPASLFTTLSGVIGLTPCGNTLRLQVQRWCTRQSRRGNVLIAVDGGTSDVNHVAALLHDLLFDNYDGVWDTANPNGARKLRMRPNRVFCIIAGSADQPRVLTALAAAPRVLHTVRGLTRDEAVWLSELLLGRAVLPAVATTACYATVQYFSPRLVHVCCGLAQRGRGVTALHESTWSRTLVHALWRELSPIERAVLARLSACRAPFDVHVAQVLCANAAELPCTMRSLVSKGVLLEFVNSADVAASARAPTWLVPAFVSTVVLERRRGGTDGTDVTAFGLLGDDVAPPPIDVLEPLLDAAVVDAATVAFVHCFAGVLGASARAQRLTATLADALAVFDRHRLALLQLLELACTAMHQPRAVRTALLHIVTPGCSLMDVLVFRVRTCELLELCSSLWLCAWSMPQSSRNARQLVAASLCLNRALYLMDGGDDAATVAEFGLDLAQRVTARSMRLDGVAAGSVMPRRMVRDGALVANALGALANVLSEDHRAAAALHPGVRHEFTRLLAYAHDRLAAMKRTFADPELQALQLTDDVLLHLTAQWQQNAQLAKDLCSGVVAAAARVASLPPPSVSSRVPASEGTAAFAFASLECVQLPDGVTTERVTRIDRALLLYCQCQLTCMLYAGTRSRDFAWTWSVMGDTLANRGLKYAALVAYKRSKMLHAASLCPDHPLIARLTSNEASVWHDLAKDDEALVHYNACLSMRVRMLGSRHLDVARTRSYIAIVLHALGKLWTALREFQLCAAIRSEQDGASPDVAATLNNTAIVMNKILAQAAKAADEPVPKPVLGLMHVQQAYERCLAIRRSTLGHIHPDVTHSLDNLAVVCFKRNDRDRAVRELSKCIDAQFKLGKLLDVARSKFKLGVVVVAVDEAKALESFQSCMELRRREGPLHPDVRTTLRDVTAVIHLQMAKVAPTLMLRSLWLDMQMQTLTDIAAAIRDTSFKASASAPRLGVPVYRYVVDAAEMQSQRGEDAGAGTGAAAGAGTGEGAGAGAGTASTAAPQRPLVDADVATTMAGMGATLVALLDSCNAHMPHVLDAASRCTLQNVAVAELQVRGNEKLDSRMAKDLGSARINAGAVFMRRGAYENAAWEFNLAVELLRPIADTAKEMYVNALLGSAEAIVRTDPARSFGFAQHARALCTDAALRQTMKRRFVLLANKLQLYDDVESPWLVREDVAALAV
jgi:tRNA A-37 threonylcarbamoyl transferase component Bud32